MNANFTIENQEPGSDNDDPAPDAVPATFQKPERWDVPFGEQMTTSDVDRIMAVAPFDQMDASKFPKSAPLRGILQNDCRIRTYAQGDFVVREGDYGNSAFLVLSGAACIALDRLPGELLGRREPEEPGLMHSLAQLWRNPRLPEVRNLNRNSNKAGRPTQGVGTREGGGNQPAIFLQDFPSVLDGKRMLELKAGEWFGEIAALGRTPRIATVLASQPTELLEIRWQGLRDIRARDPKFKEHIDQLYRARSLETHLRETPGLSHLPHEVLSKLTEQTRFESHGRFDWQGTFKALIEQLTPAERLTQEPVIAQQGDLTDGLILIRAGFCRLSERYNHGERTVSYLGRGEVFGFKELLAGWRAGKQMPLDRSLRGVGFVDVLVIPRQAIEEHVLHTLTPAMLEDLGIGPSPAPSVAENPDARVKPEMLEFLVDNRFVNGTAAMIIDLDRCTRCDDCVRACASAHNNNPRFIRHGPQNDSFMLASACMHCADPVCMIGCPTGAIHRTAIGGQVVINDDTCIGCATCANSCPYNNIQMVDVRDSNGNFYRDSVTSLPIQKAAKCDLCVDQLGGPACARACPHDALARLDLNSAGSLIQWLNR